MGNPFFANINFHFFSVYCEKPRSLAAFLIEAMRCDCESSKSSKFTRPPRLFIDDYSIELQGVRLGADVLAIISVTVFAELDQTINKHAVQPSSATIVGIFVISPTGALKGAGSNSTLSRL